MSQNFSHIDEDGSVRMVDVSQKPLTAREAKAQAIVTMKPETLELIQHNRADKGNVLETARIAGVMAAKRTSELIPMCHPLQITCVRVDFVFLAASSQIRIEATAGCVGQTGVEMEALTAAAVSGLTIYDMCKSYDRSMTISDICLIMKSGGASGYFVRA